MPYVFGCQVGGGIYQFAALIGGYDLPLRGANFLRVESILLGFYSERFGVSSA